jgi:hypothetical protein
MAVKRSQVHVEDGRPGLNLALIGLVGLCVEFWVVVASALAENL